MFSAGIHQRGFSLLEMLVALVVFSIGMLAVAGLQSVSKRANFESVQRTAAAQVATGLLEDMRTNGDAIDIYRTAGALGNGARGNEPVPNCRGGVECNSIQKAAYDLWFWEQVIDGDMESSGGNATGGLMLPTMCITGPAVGGPGIYQITIAWRGSVSLVNSVNDACGTASGNYGAQNEFRRIMQIPTYIDPNF